MKFQCPYCKLHAVNILQFVLHKYRKSQKQLKEHFHLYLDALSTNAYCNLHSPSGNLGVSSFQFYNIRTKEIRSIP